MTAIDLFAGLGGFSLAAEMAGLKVLWAANHTPDAVRWHALNHPRVTHACQDLQQANWAEVPDADVLLASPACQGHSRARGKERAHHQTTRATAWAVVACAEVKRPRFLVVENVPQFRDWTLFPQWKSALESLGFAIRVIVANAADSGVPQDRERVFVCGWRGVKHAPEIRLPKRAHVPASSLVSFDGEEHWTPVRTLCAATRAKCGAARRRFGDRFLVAYYGNEAGGRDLGKPLGTVTTRDRFGLVSNNRLRMLTVDEYRRAMSFPDTYRLPPQKRLATHLLGNAAPPWMARDVINAVKNA